MYCAQRSAVLMSTSLARELRQLCSRFFLRNGAAVDPARCALAQICAAMERYTRVKVIGKGAFGAAILVHARGDRRSQYVIKHVDVTRLDATTPIRSHA